MATTALSQFENDFEQLSPEAQFSLLERLALRARRASPEQHNAWEAELEAMAADPEIQREVSNINAEFKVTEADGLGK